MFCLPRKDRAGMGTGLHGMNAASVSVCKAASVGCMGMCREFEYYTTGDGRIQNRSLTVAYHLRQYSVLEYKCLKGITNNMNLFA
jgi:hypothetical protein